MPLPSSGRTATCSTKDSSAEVERIAAALRQLGIRRGESIVIVLPNGPALATMIPASMTAGIAAPLSWGMTRHEYLKAMSNDAGRIVVLPAGQESPARKAATEMRLPLFELASAPPRGTQTFHLIGDPIGPPAPEVRPQADDIACIINSSGTTGRPKRITRTHRNITTTLADVQRAIGTSPSDRCLGAAPMTFSQGVLMPCSSVCGLADHSSLCRGSTWQDFQINYRRFVPPGSRLRPACYARSPWTRQHAARFEKFPAVHSGQRGGALKGGNCLPGRTPGNTGAPQLWDVGGVLHRRGALRGTLTQTRVGRNAEPR